MIDIILIYRLNKYFGFSRTQQKAQHFVWLEAVRGDCGRMKLLAMSPAYLGTSHMFGLLGGCQISGKPRGGDRRDCRACKKHLAEKSSPPPLRVKNLPVSWLTAAVPKIYALEKVENFINRIASTRTVSPAWPSVTWTLAVHSLAPPDAIRRCDARFHVQQN